MSFKMQNSEEMLNKFIGGFRQYIKNTDSGCIRLSFASEGLFDMLGYDRSALSGEGDPFCALVHPSDR